MAGVSVLGPPLSILSSMHRQSRVALVAVTFLSLTPFALEAQDGWNLPLDPARTIRAGDSRSSSLDGGDRVLGDGSYFEAWFFQGRAGQRVTITMRAGGFDTFLALGRHNGETIEDNDDYDPGESTNSRISLELPDDGLYVIRANSLEASQTGDYTLSLEEGGDDADDDNASGSTAVATALRARVDPARMLRSGQSVSGVLDASDSKLDDDSYFELYYVELAAGQQMSVTMRSSAFDTYLSIGAHGATEPAESNDDIEEGDTDSRIDFTAPSAGTYVIIANSLESDEMGEYTVVATLSSGEKVGGLAGELMDEAGGNGATPASARVVTLGQTLSSELGSDDERLDDDSFFELWSFQGQAGSQVTITMRSADFDAYLTIRDTADEILGTDDDTGGGTDAQVTVTIPANGRIAIVANSLTEGETGRYTLQVARAN